MISEYNLNTKLTPFDMNVNSRVFVSKSTMWDIWDIWYINVVVLKGFIIDGCVSQQTLIDFYIFILTSTGSYAISVFDKIQNIIHHIRWWVLF